MPGMIAPTPPGPEAIKFFWESALLGELDFNTVGVAFQWGKGGAELPQRSEADPPFPWVAWRLGESPLRVLVVPGGGVGMAADKVPLKLSLLPRPLDVTGLGEGRESRALDKLGQKHHNPNCLGFGTVVPGTREREKASPNPDALSFS
jgi:hypothetical protein